MSERHAPRLTLDGLLDVAYAWSEAIYDIESCERLLLDGSFRAFLVYQGFMDRFSASPEDTRKHKLYYGERFRMQAIQAPVIAHHHGKTRSRHYRSKLAEDGQLALARQAGYDDLASWMEAEHPKAIDSCPDALHRTMAASLSQAGKRQEFLEQLGSEVRLAIEGEARRFVKGPSGCFARDRRHETVMACCSKYLSPLGFLPVTTRYANYIRFEHRITDDIVLRWNIGDEDDAFFTFRDAPLSPRLYVTESKFKSRPRDATARAMFLEIPFAHMVEGFHYAYNRCVDETEMELTTSAHASILGWLLPSIVSAVKQYLA